MFAEAPHGFKARKVKELDLLMGKLRPVVAKIVILKSGNPLKSNLYYFIFWSDTIHSPRSKIIVSSYPLTFTLLGSKCLLVVKHDKIQWQGII